MIEFFTVLVIEYEMQSKTIRSHILFETWDHCEQTLRIDELYGVFYDNYKNTSMNCQQTEMRSKLIRPKLRPSPLKQ